MSQTQKKAVAAPKSPPPPASGGDLSERLARQEAQTKYFATQADIQGVNLEVQKVRTEMQEMKQELKGDIQRVEQELKGDIQRVEKELKLEIQGVRGEIKDVKIWILGGVLAGTVSAVVVIAGLARVVEIWSGG